MLLLLLSLLAFPPFLLSPFPSPFSPFLPFLSPFFPFPLPLFSFPLPLPFPLPLFPLFPPFPLFSLLIFPPYMGPGPRTEPVMYTSLCMYPLAHRMTHQLQELCLPRTSSRCKSLSCCQWHSARCMRQALLNSHLHTLFVGLLAVAVALGLHHTRRVGSKASTHKQLAYAHLRAYSCTAAAVAANIRMA